MRVFFLLSLLLATTLAIDSADLAAYNTIYSKANGANWVFPPSADPCGWTAGKRSINCNTSGKITFFNLFDNNLTGAFPTEFGLLTSLTTLVLRKNGLTGTIPTQIQNLANLQRLEIHENQLSGDIPSFLTGLPLRILRLRDNNFAGVLPDFSSVSTLSKFEFGNNPKCPIPNYGSYAPETDFTSLNCACNVSPCQNGGVCTATGPSPQDFTCDCSATGYYDSICSTLSADTAVLTTLYNQAGGSKWNWKPDLGRPLCGQDYRIVCNSNGRVSELNLQGNGLRGQIPNLSSLTSLEVLNLADNDIYGTLATSISTMSLKTIDLSNNQFYGPVPTEIGFITSLVNLVLDGNKFSGNIPTHIGSLTNLKVFSINDNLISGTIVTQVSKLTNLVNFSAARNSLSGTFPTQLANLPLEILDIRNNKLTNQIPSPILANILRISGNYFSGSVPTGLSSSGVEFMEIGDNGYCTVPDYSGYATFYTDFVDTSCKPCGSNPCTNGGTCNDLGGSFSCSCFSGFSGSLCETVDFCGVSPCFNGGTCTSLSTTFQCSCATGWSGPTCETPDFCDLSPCLNGGTCSSLPTNFTCSCPVGFTSDRCEVQNFCELGLCLNGATCVSLGSTYRCDCPPEYYGEDCGEFDACTLGLCQNGATCVRSLSTYTCSCPLSYYGTNCENQGPISLPAAVSLSSPLIYYPFSSPYYDQPLIGSQTLSGLYIPQLTTTGAIQRNGDTGNEFISIISSGNPLTPSSTFSCGGSQMTVEFVVKPDPATITTTQSQILLTLTSTSTLKFQLTWNQRLILLNGSDNTLIRASPQLDGTIWYHVIFTIDTSSGSSVYVNNVKTTGPSSAFSFGTITVSICPTCVASFDDFALYCSLFSDSDVSTHFTALFG